MPGLVSFVSLSDLWTIKQTGKKATTFLRYA